MMLAATITISPMCKHRLFRFAREWSLLAAVLVSVCVRAETPPPGWKVLPSHGDRFEIHQEVLTEGTFTIRDGSPQPFSQKVLLDFAALAIRSASTVGLLNLEYTFDRLLLETEIGSSSSTIEVTPNRAVLDGTALFDRSADSDTPASILTYLLNETFRLVVGEERKLQRVGKARKDRHPFSLYDLGAPVRETWVTLPPRSVGAGFTWQETRPLRMLSGAASIPATRTHGLVSIPKTAGEPMRIQTAVTAALTDPVGVPSRLGVHVPYNLRIDALGSDLLKPPPTTRIVSFAAEATQETQYRPDWGFLAGRSATARVGATLEVPESDGQIRYRKEMFFRRETRVEVDKVPLPEMNEDARFILLGANR
jgi:hypothetical protein